jgi:hypothetical protein
MGMRKVDEPKKPGRSRCFYCDAEGVSDEHMFGQWLNKLLRTEERGHRRWHANAEIGAGTVYVTPYPDVRKQGGVLGKKIRAVCKACNGGWLSRIQDSAAPTIKKLVDDEVFVLSPQEIGTLCSWITNADLLVDISDPYSSVSLKSDFDHFYATKAPPDSWRIWLGRYQGTAWAPSRVFHYGATMQARHPELGVIWNRLQLFIAVMGKFFVLLQSSHDGTVFKFPTQFPFHMTQIWPLTGKPLEWPITCISSDSDMENFKNFPVAVAGTSMGRAAMTGLK